MMRPCPSCACHVLPADGPCPHCGAPIGSPGLGAALLALALFGCDPIKGTEPPYGVPTTDTDTDADSDTDSDADSDTDSDADSDTDDTGNR